MEMEAFHEIGMEIERIRKVKLIIGMIPKEEAEMESKYEAEIAKINNRLNRSAVKGNWEEVVRIYEETPMAHTAKITKSGDTALHLAISDGKENIVEQLVEQIVKEGLRPNFTSMGDDRGNTPLHLAASVGSVKMCNCIALKDLELVGARNDYGETPLFMAALHGKKDAFLCLHSMCGKEKGYSYCRRKDGDTILHSAIAGDYFDLALHIIYLYKDLVSFVNERGISPLHLLAIKPSAFESGGNLGWLDRIIYHLLSRKQSPGNWQGDVESGGRSATLRLQGRNESDNGAQGHGRFPPNYNTCFEFIKHVFKFIELVLKELLAINILGYTRIKRIREEKEKHKLVLQLVEEILVKATAYLGYAPGGRAPPQRQENGGSGYTTGGMAPPQRQESFFSGSEDSHETHGQGILGGDKFKIVVSPQRIVCHCHKRGNLLRDEKQKVYTADIGKGETPILVASKMGVKEMVNKILEYAPAALHDVNSDGKNLVHLAMESRQPDVYLFLKETLAEHIFRHTDLQGNTALHLAARLGKSLPWQIPGPALQMQCEIKWFQYVQNSMHPNFSTRYNNKGQTAEDVFTVTHKKLVKEGSQWLTKTAESCSVVAALIATVAFATSATVPGGTKQDTGTPTFQGEPAFYAFAISSLIALCFSVISLITFLSIFTSSHQEEDFGSRLPRKFLLALTSLLISIASMLVSFCSSHFFILQERLKLKAYALYALSCLTVTLIVAFQFPLYYDIIRSTFAIVPQRSYKKAARYF